MADNFLERHREEYEKKKAAWLLRKKSKPSASKIFQKSCQEFGDE